MLDSKVLSHELMLSSNVVKESDLREGLDVRV